MWSRCHGHAIAQWQKQFTKGDNPNHTLNESPLWATIEEHRTQRGRKRIRDPYPVVGGSRQPKVRFQEIDEEWYARSLNPGGRKREIDHVLGRDVVASKSFHEPQGGDEGMRGPGEPSTAGSSGQNGQQNEGGHDTSAGASTQSENKSPCNEAENFLSSFCCKRSNNRGSDTWSEEAEAFLNAPL